MWTGRPAVSTPSWVRSLSGMYRADQRRGPGGPCIMARRTGGTRSCPRPSCRWRRASRSPAPFPTTAQAGSVRTAPEASVAGMMVRRNDGFPPRWITANMSATVLLASPMPIVPAPPRVHRRGLEIICVDCAQDLLTARVAQHLDNRRLFVGFRLPQGRRSIHILHIGVGARVEQ